MLSGLDISVDHASLLHTLVGTQLGDELPDELVAEYWLLKRCFDRIGAPLSERELALLAWKQGYGKPIRNEGRRNIAIEFKKKQIPYGTPVEALWRKEWKPGKLVGANREQTHLIVEIDGTERSLNSAMVRIPEPAGV